MPRNQTPQDRQDTDTEKGGPTTQAEIRLTSNDIAQDLAFFTETLKFRLETIMPADDPSVAVISGHGLRLRLERGAGEAPSTIRIHCDDPDRFADGKRDLKAPNGTRIEIAEAQTSLDVPPFQPRFMVRRLTDGDAWVVERAGMQYRDLIPDRLGGGIIASHIRIPEGGPVPDKVHFHTVRFQLIYCYRGWVKVVYEDQGPPFILEAGDCVTQPPRIRHRVLEASDNLEVIEVGVPAVHLTTMDHEMALPTPVHNPERIFAGQVFCRHRAADAVWEPGRLSGFEARDTGIAKASGGVADVRVIRRLAKEGNEQAASPNASLLFSVVLQGGMALHASGHAPETVTAGDAFVIPPHMPATYQTCSDNLEILEVLLP